MKRGKFITLEGGEGVGKTTNLQYIQQFLLEQQIEVVVTREPGGVPVAEKLRSLIVEETSLYPEAELLLLFAGRVHHIQELILPSLNQGKWVICDRFTDASYAYQGEGRGIAWRRIEYLEDWLQKGLKPDLTLLLDAPVEAGLNRTRQRTDNNRFEKESLAFMQRVRRGYLLLSQLHPERIRRIDATRPLSQVQAQIGGILQELITSWRQS